MMRRSMNSSSGSAPCQDDFGSHRGPVFRIHHGVSYFYREASLLEGWPRRSSQCRSCPAPLFQPVIIVQSLSLEHGISCNSCIVLRHTFLSFSSSLSSFVKISLKFYSIGDELFFHASRKLQASFYYSKIGLAWIICWPGPETTSVCTTECLCVAHSFFRFIVIVGHYRGPQAWYLKCYRLSRSRDLCLCGWYTHTHTHRSSSSFFFLFFSNGRVLPPRLARSSRRKRVRVYTSSCDKPCNSIELARNRSTTILC